MNLLHDDIDTSCINEREKYSWQLPFHPHWYINRTWLSPQRDKTPGMKKGRNQQLPLCVPKELKLRWKNVLVRPPYWAPGVLVHCKLIAPPEVGFILTGFRRTNSFSPHLCIGDGEILIRMFERLTRRYLLGAALQKTLSTKEEPTNTSGLYHWHIILLLGSLFHPRALFLPAFMT
jgi:hypothetical protein